MPWLVSTAPPDSSCWCGQPAQRTVITSNGEHHGHYCTTHGRPAYQALRPDPPAEAA
jgi:hypothetical protein